MNCDDCKGTGTITLLTSTKTCTTCNGTGKKNVKKTYAEADFSNLPTQMYGVPITYTDNATPPEPLTVKMLFKLAGIPNGFTRTTPADPDTDNSTPVFDPDAPDA